MGLENPIHIIFIILILLLLFGSARLPKLAKSLREARDEFNKSSTPEKKDETPAPPAAEPPLAQETPPADAPPASS